MKHFSIIQVLQENDIQSSVSMMSPGEHVVPFRACLPAGGDGWISICPCFKNGAVVVGEKT